MSRAGKSSACKTVTDRQFWLKSYSNCNKTHNLNIYSMVICSGGYLILEFSEFHHFGLFLLGLLGVLGQLVHIRLDLQSVQSISGDLICILYNESVQTTSRHRERDRM